MKLPDGPPKHGPHRRIKTSDKDAARKIKSTSKAQRSIDKEEARKAIGADPLPEIQIFTGKDASDKADENFCPDSPIRIKRMELNHQIKQAQEELKQLQQECPHKHPVRDGHSGKLYCPECGLSGYTLTTE